MIVYTGTSLKHVLSIKEHGLPVGSFVGTHPYIGEYFARLHPDSIIIALDIPDIASYSKVTDSYAIGDSLQITSPPRSQKVVRVGWSESDFAGLLSKSKHVKVARLKR